ncbi:SH3 domain-containing protein [Streptomyces sp. MMG1121]|uniref:SH3 domain-containing protein n=1 Tax=Streptomyces sp. MMG1121 TaxID=1415544 RepID=UPI0006AE8D97|nr:SH3 domain-containing protein [Streptomyces sp. MMG1121]KOV61343.1 hypothetical protein ADK64_28150 [Streptomyces sp. MMG1121]
MILRTLKSGLLATVAVLAFLPTAAGAATANAATAYPAPGAIAQHHTHSAPYRIHHHRYDAYRLHHLRHAYRIHRFHRLGAPGTAYRFAPRTAAYSWGAPAASYRLASHVTGRVTTRHARLNIRSGPGTGYRVVGHRHTNRLLHLTCKTRGSWVAGNRTWYRLTHHRGYVSAHYVRTHRALPWC